MKPIFNYLLLCSAVFIFVACSDSVVGKYHIENDANYEFRYIELRRDKSVKISYRWPTGGFIEENLGQYEIDGNNIKIIMENYSTHSLTTSSELPLIPALAYWGEYSTVNGVVAKVLYGTIEDGKLFLTDYHPEAVLVKK